MAQVSEISVTSDYGLADLRTELKDLYRKAGVKPAIPIVFMLTDSQVTTAQEERSEMYMFMTNCPYQSSDRREPDYMPWFLA